MTSHPIGSVTTVMHDTADLEAATAFWTEILGLEVVQRDDTYAYLGRMSENGPHLAFQQVPEAKEVKNRLHLDIRVPDRSAFEDLIVSLGGRVVEVQDQPGWPVWTVMADPEGNEFCIYDRED